MLINYTHIGVCISKIESINAVNFKIIDRANEMVKQTWNMRSGIMAHRKLQRTGNVCNTSGVKQQGQI